MTGIPPFTVVRADHVGFAVSSLDRAVRFWTNVLGARLVRTGEMGGDFLGEVTGARGAHVRVATVEIAGQSVELLEYRDAPGAAGSARPFDPGAAHLALVVDDLDAVLAVIAAQGWRAQGLPQAISAGPRAGTRLMYALGPDGETVEFMQPPDRP